MASTPPSTNVSRTKQAACKAPRRTCLFAIEKDKENERINYHNTVSNVNKVISDLPIAPDLVYSVMEQFVPLESWPCDTIGCRHEAKHFFSNEDDDNLNSLCIICFADQNKLGLVRY